VFDINEERGEAIAAELQKSVLWPGATDVASEESVVASMEKGVAKFGKISGVINCGGIGMAQKVYQEEKRKQTKEESQNCGKQKKLTDISPLF